jgi:hypothetical protein
MLSPSARMNRPSDVHRLRSALILPLFAGLVGFLLTGTSVGRRTAPRADIASIEHSPPSLAIANGAARSPLVVESHRRVASIGSDALAEKTFGFVNELRARPTHAARNYQPGTSSAARGYDATAPPRRPV